MSDSSMIPIEKIIAECDRYFNAGNAPAAGAFLRTWRAKANVSGDLKAELSILNELIGHYRMEKDPGHGIQAVKDAMQLINKIGISGSVSAGTIQLNAATALCSFGKIDEALALYRQTEICYAENLPEDDLLFSGLYNNMAAAYIEKSMYEKAEELYLQAIDLLDRHRKLMDLAVAYVNLAQLYKRRGDDDDMVFSALDCAMICFDAEDVPRDGYYAHTCCKCSGAFAELGRTDIQNELDARASDIYENNSKS